MAETDADKFDRLEAMSKDRGETWDLSRNDRAALKWAVKLLRGPLLAAVEHGRREADSRPDRAAADRDRVRNEALEEALTAMRDQLQNRRDDALRMIEAVRSLKAALPETAVGERKQAPCLSCGEVIPVKADLIGCPRCGVCRYDAKNGMRAAPQPPPALTETGGDGRADAACAGCGAKPLAFIAPLGLLCAFCRRPESIEDLRRERHAVIPPTEDQTQREGGGDRG